MRGVNFHETPAASIGNGAPSMLGRLQCYRRYNYAPVPGRRRPAISADTAITCRVAKHSESKVDVVRLVSGRDGISQNDLASRRGRWDEHVHVDAALQQRTPHLEARLDARHADGADRTRRSRGRHPEAAQS